MEIATYLIIINDYSKDKQVDELIKETKSLILENLLNCQGKELYELIMQ